MEQSAKDQALRQALVPIEPKRLPSNFAYTTMRRIRQEQHEAEHRQHIAAVVSIVVVCLLGFGALIYFFGGVLWESFASVFSQPDAAVLSLCSLFCLTFFALLNRWLSHRFRTDVKD